MAKIYHPDFFRRPGHPFTPPVLAEAKRHAAQDAPNEACGLVVSGDYIPCANVADDPASQFKIAAEELAQAYASGTLEGVVHSHPGGPYWPTRADMLGQLETQVPWAILVPGEETAELACWWGGKRPPVFTSDGLHVPRAFLPQVSDCYSIIQDWFLEARGVALMDMPRQWEWWKDLDTYGSLYLENFEQAGFECVSQDPDAFARLAEPGDVYLMKIRSKVPNHGGIYLGEGLNLEHIEGCLSHREPMARKVKHITHLMRYRG
ncbi:MAG: C40 family peptidase [Pseudomonadota bacterium]